LEFWGEDLQPSGTSQVPDSIRIESEFSDLGLKISLALSPVLVLWVMHATLWLGSRCWVGSCMWPVSDEPLHSESEFLDLGLKNSFAISCPFSGYDSCVPLSGLGGIAEWVVICNPLVMRGQSLWVFSIMTY
jgi:hypothetical protein